MAKLDKLTALLLSEPLEDIYANVVDRLVVNICRHLVTGDAKRTARWEVTKLKEMGQLTAENAKIINESMKQIPQELYDMLDETRRIALEDIQKNIDEAIASGTIEKAPIDSTEESLKSLMSQAESRLNIVNSNLLTSSQSAFTTVLNTVKEWSNTQEQAIDILNENAIAFTAGTETREQIMRKAIGQLADNGIYGFIDRAGRKWSPEAYVSMDMRTTAHNAALESIKSRQKDYNSDIFQVSTHAGARPLCYPYQGKFYTWRNESGTFTDGSGKKYRYKPISSTSYGKPAGLFGINCGHYPLPQIPGVTLPQDIDKQSKEENDDEYKAAQQQRLLERKVRGEKRKEAAYKAAGMSEAAKEQHKKVLQAQKNIRDFTQKTGRRRRFDREKIYNYNQIDTTMVLRKTGGIPPKAKVNLTPKKIDLDTLTFDDEHINSERGHSVTEKEAKQWISKADFSVSVWNGKFERYYGNEGTVYVDTVNNKIRTAYSKSQYDNNVKKLMGVYNDAISGKR